MIGTIEQAIVDKLKDAALGYTLKDVKSYGGELEAKASEIVKRTPAVFVTFSGEAKPEQIASSAWRHVPRFSIICATRNRRNEKAARRGAAGDVGTYQMVEDMRRVLLFGLGLSDVGEVKPGRVVQIHNEKNLSIYAIEIETSYVTELTLDETTLDNFVTLHSDWDLPPLGNVIAPLPAAENDAEDLIKPEQ